ncbi:MAG: glycosyltransferase family 9 protein [Nitrospira sp.]
MLRKLLRLDRMGQRALLIQLARLGDLVQTIPAIRALEEAHAERTLDLLCPEHLDEIGRALPGISRVVKWDGAAWSRRARLAEQMFQTEQLAEADAELAAMVSESYDYAFVLNQHPRAVLAGALLARTSLGALVGGPLAQSLSPWAAHVRGVAGGRGENRIHLADAFCGMCGVLPPRGLVPIQVFAAALPGSLDAIGAGSGPWIGLVIGAGERERVVPESVWGQLIVGCLDSLPCSRIVLMGSQPEHERAQAMLAALPSQVQGRVWDTTGRLSLIELAAVLRRCQVVVGADTGPLHLAAAVGTHVIGWYFARARVHETGPYGLGHWVWQAEGTGRIKAGGIQPTSWPIAETIALLSDRVPASSTGWSLWSSRRDRWGAYYVEAGHEPIAPLQREQVWQELQLTSVS